MKYIFMLIIFVVSLSAIPILAGEENYDDCILEHLKNTKLNWAVEIIKKACRENYKDLTTLSNDSKRREYNECLLEYLPGTESLDAADEIRKACERKHL